RIACENTRFALPEIRLGLIPGSHGTQRLPRLVGLAEAARMILTGETIHGGRALEIGWIVLVAGSADPVAIATLTPRPVAALAGGAPEALRNLADAAEHRIHNPAYQAIAETLAAAAQLPFEKGAEVEADWFRRLLPSAPARAQRYLFFAEGR